MKSGLETLHFPFSLFNKTPCGPNQGLHYFYSLEYHKLTFDFATASLSQQATTLTSLANQVLNGKNYPPHSHTTWVLSCQMHECE